MLAILNLRKMVIHFAQIAGDALINLHFVVFYFVYWFLLFADIDV